MDRSAQAYENAIRNLEDYVNNPRGVKLDWNSVQLAKDYSSVPGSLGTRAREALAKYARL